MAYGFLRTAEDILGIELWAWVIPSRNLNFLALPDNNIHIFVCILTGSLLTIGSPFSLKQRIFF